MANLDDMRAKKAQEVSVRDMKPKDQVKHYLEGNKQAIAQALPRHMNPERLTRVALTAATTTPGLLECHIPTLIGGVVQCATMGLEPNTVLGHAYLIPFWNNKQKRKDVQVIIGYKGLIDLARRSGQIVSIAAHAVRSGDEFDFAYGLDEKLVHRPAGDESPITHFYAVAKLKDGGHAFEVMTKTQVDRIKAMAQGGGQRGPWNDHYEEMGRKTVIRRLAKYLPLSVEFATASALDGMAEGGQDQRLDTVLDGEYSLLQRDESVPQEVEPEAAGEPEAEAESK